MKHLLQLARPLNSLMAAMTSLLGSWLTTRDLNLPAIWIGAMVVGLVTAGGNVMNDIADIGADSFNHPQRGLVTGKVTRAWAIGLLSLTWGGAALLSALVLDGNSANIVALVLVALTLYNTLLKKWPLIGNILVAAVSWSVLWFGATVAARGGALFDSQLIIVGALCGALLHFARELVKSVQDMKGDRAQGRHTLPILFGARASLLLAVVVIVAVPIVAYAQLGQHVSNWLVLLLAYISILLLSLLLRALMIAGGKSLVILSVGIKVAMALGLLLLLVSDLLSK